MAYNVFRRSDLNPFEEIARLQAEKLQKEMEEVDSFVARAEIWLKTIKETTPEDEIQSLCIALAGLAAFQWWMRGLKAESHNASFQSSKEILARSFESWLEYYLNMELLQNDDS